MKMRRMLCAALAVLMLAMAIPGAASATGVFASIKLDKLTGTIVADTGNPADSTLTIKATVVGGTSIEWSTLNADIIQMSAVGNECTVSAISAGIARITARLQGTNRYAVCTIHVKTSPEELVVVPAAAYLKSGTGGSLSARIRPSIAVKDVEWVSSDPTVVSVNAKTGSYRGLRKGVATITATTKFGGKSDSAVITVVDRPLQSVRLAMSAAPTAPVTFVDMIEGETIDLVPIFNPVNCDADLQVATWSTRTPNSMVASVDANGRVTAIQAGSEQIVAEVGFGKVARVTIRVKSAPDEVVMRYVSAVVQQTKSFQLGATVYPKGAAGYVTWESSDPSLLKVDSRGKITAVGVGINNPVSTVIVTATTPNGKVGSTEVTIVYVPVRTVILKPDRCDIEVGDTVQLTTEVLPATASLPDVTYSSDHPEVATVDANGLVTAVRSGIAYIRAVTVDGKKTDITKIVITNPAP